MKYMEAEFVWMPNHTALLRLPAIETGMAVNIDARTKRMYFGRHAFPSQSLKVAARTEREPLSAKPRECAEECVLAQTDVACSAACSR